MVHTSSDRKIKMHLMAVIEMAGGMAHTQAVLLQARAEACAATVNSKICVAGRVVVAC